VALLLTTFAVTIAAQLGSAAPPELPDGTAEATRRIPTFKVPDGMKIELFAAEPKLASPVAIGLDERNRVFVAEEYRFNLGTEENRTRPFLLEDDLQIQTLDDRLKMYEKFASRFEGGMDWFRKVADQVRMVEDTDGDGKADRSTAFAPGFNGTLDGLAAGVMAADGDIYFTCIPNLWRLRDTDGDGIADERTVIHTGFGVNAGFLGHDLHGLCWGPDGKLYFSIGDRGFHVLTKEGRILHGPRTGAVFRCYPDGRELEVVCRGLRNPQELAFDQFGNLFAADNNCDKGDHSRLVYCVEGSDSGWNMAYQSIPAPYLTGPWHAEQMWHLWSGDVASQPDRRPEGSAASTIRPAWVLPPVARLGAGPSGFTYYPGTGLSAKYDHHFFMCNYTGNGGIDSFSIRPRGAGFETFDEHTFLSPISATDCEFGYDGKLYVSDFVSLIWNGGSAGGRIYTLFDPRLVQEPPVTQTAELVRKGFRQLPSGRLVELLAHIDMRVRQRAQFELAARGEESIPLFQAVLASSANRMQRLHALWGLGQLAGTQTSRGENAETIRGKSYDLISTVIGDKDDEIRAWSVRLLGEHARHQDLTIPQPESLLVLKCLSDASPRVRLFAALAMAHFHYDTAPHELLALIRDNNDADPWIRHACVIAAARLAHPTIGSRLHTLARDKSPAVRMVALLAARHAHLQRHHWSYDLNHNPAVKSITDVQMQNDLHDDQLTLVTEAARAINDLPLDHSLPKLSAMVSALKGSSAATAPDALTRRIINANFRLGTVDHARQVLELVTERGLSLSMRQEALAALLDWETPGLRDRVTGFWRPVPPRNPDDMTRVKELLADHVAALLGQQSELQPDVLKLIAHYKLPTDDTIFANWISDDTKDVATQAASLKLLASRKSALAAESIDKALKSSRPFLRAEAREALATIAPEQAVTLLKEVLETGDNATERQRALATLASLKAPAADAILNSWTRKLLDDQVPDILLIEVVDAATLRDLPELKQRVAQYQARLNSSDLTTRYRGSLVGGNADRGRELFLGHRVGQCVRCHKIGTTVSGGTAGPDLRQVATRHDRTSLLQSLVDPNAKIAKGYETVTLVLSDGRVFGGLIRKEADGIILLEKPDGGEVSINSGDVEERSLPKSAMPEMHRALTGRELRDLVEFLSELK
jgi:quinoprotein glucose dehydrogenase